MGGSQGDGFEVPVDEEASIFVAGVGTNWVGIIRGIDSSLGRIWRSML